jgi:hypothetical protein
MAAVGDRGLPTGNGGGAVMSEEKGLTYIPQIEAAWEALVESHKASLAHALNLGGLLNDAKEAVDHGAWGKWLEKHLPNISQRTANVYMNLAKHKDKFTVEANSQRAAILGTEGDLSIRDAIEAVNKADGGGQDANKGAAKGKGGGRKKTAAPKGEGDQPQPASAPIDAQLENLDVDEVMPALEEKWDEDKRKRLVQGLLEALSTEDVYEALTEAFDDDQLKKLVDDLTNYLTEPSGEPKVQPAAAAKATAQPQTRRI